MQTKTAMGLLLLWLLIGSGCSSVPVRDFRADYQKASSRSVKIDGYPPFNVSELPGQRRLKVELNTLAQVFGSIADPLVLMGISDGIPSASVHETAALTYLAETGRPSCKILDTATSPTGREFEFQFAC
jgi:hypothetical protein